MQFWGIYKNIKILTSVTERVKGSGFETVYPTDWTLAISLLELQTIKPTKFEVVGIKGLQTLRGRVQVRFTVATHGLCTPSPSDSD